MVDGEVVDNQIQMEDFLLSRKLLISNSMQEKINE
jgi:hypothetical protein